MATTPEGKVKKRISSILAANGVWFFLPVSSGYGKHGIPDYISCVPTVITQDMVGKTVGLFVGIEAKAGDKKPTPLQINQMNNIKKAHGLAIVVNESRIDALKKLILKLTRGE